jgi:aspartyl protease family protein
MVLRLRVLAASLLCAAPLAAWAQAGPSVALSGVMGNQALLVINGGAPRMVAAGAVTDGVKVISASGSQAVVEIAGRRETLTVGGAPVSVGARAGGGDGGDRIVLQLGRGGHFFGQARINGKMAEFMVDTGATALGIGQAEAERLGIRWQEGQRVMMNTANGVVPGYVIRLNSVSVNGVEVFGVDAVVGAAPMPYILLGNSFLSRFQMQRDSDRMILTRRY